MNPNSGITETARSVPSAWRSRVPLALVLAGLATIASAQHDPPASPSIVGLPFLVSQHVIAGGGTERSSNPCYELAGTIGQPVVGRTQGGAFTVDAGFWGKPISTDSIFRSSFEACQP